MKIHPVTFFLAIIAVLIACLIPHLDKPRKSAAKAFAISSMKHIGIAMTEFESQFGHRPLSHTRIEFETPYPQQDREDSNALLGQLIASGMCDSEKIFTLRSGAYSSSLADDVLSPASEILKPGECHFTYISSKKGNGEYTGSSGLPVIVSHMIPGTSQFDPDIFNHEAAYLKLDSSVATCKVSPDGKALCKGQGQLGLLDHGPDTLWGNQEPQLHHPLQFQPSFIRRNILSKPFYTTLALILLYLLIRIVFTTRKWLLIKRTFS
ncbi:hypothetical protein N9Z83_00270 [Akkermansiaceae bacterium]|nr:hypothetical protein [Akkermansiaceae bacterium]